MYIVEQVVGVFVSHVMEEMSEIVKLTPPEQARVSECNVDVSVPHLIQKINVIQLLHQMQTRKLVVEEIVDIAGPLVMEGTVEVVKFVPRRRVEDRTVELTAEVPSPRNEERLGEAIKSEHVEEPNMNDLGKHSHVD